MSLSQDTTDITTRIGARVRLARVRAGLSQSALGEMLGVTFQQVQKYEKGTNRIAAATLHRIATAVRTPIAALLDSDAHQDGAVEAYDLATLTPQGLRLALAFERIADPKVKTSLLGMAESLAAPLDA